ncbi:AMP-dependent synthetase/ligase [Streptomyces hoynatensis]|uniref:Long-chain fatty acid--CoA ligase n=1 Tax=Streptomyces hoynatensis TaxID=1141874 RepID=A0A3A9YT20_9ACTN|nr:AMP-dependent synthetase/ligase [Streptomyces hoynatensis]RKN39183.1 long-chain fatty acid--CoA ligase [Streptomyces hoynatensis]
MARESPPRAAGTLPAPLLTLDGGRVTGAATPPVARPPDSGSLADLPFLNAGQAPDEVLFSRRFSRGDPGAEGGRGGGGNGDAGWQDVTCAEFAAEVLALAKGLIAYGLRPGDRLAIMCRPRYEWTLVDFAAWAAGLITVPVYHTASPHQASWVLSDSGARACVVEGVREARTLTAVRHRLPVLEHLWQLDAISAHQNSAIGQISAYGRGVPDEAVTERRANLMPWLAATVIYTSGTTGVPRGCVLTHANLMAEVDAAIEALRPVFAEPTPGERPSTLLFLPPAHVLGRIVTLGCVRARVRLGHAPSLRTEDLLADLASFRPTFLFAIPYLLEKVFNGARARAEELGKAGSFDRAARVARRYGAASEARQHGGVHGPGLGLRAARSLYDTLVYRRVRAALGGRVRHVICGGSPLGRRLGTFYEGAGVSVYEGYGLTETSAAVTVTPPDAPRIGTVGRPLPGTEVRTAPDGEVLVRGPQVFGGYWDAALGRVLPATDAEGWLATGDLGSLDEDGYLAITGRKKDLIITSGGKNVAPAPLEDCLRAHPLISQCVVVGDNRPYLAALLTLDADGLHHWRLLAGLGDVPQAELLRDPELLRQLQRAVDEANDLVSSAESIRRFRVLPRDFTIDSGYLTPSLKLRRAEVLRDFETEIDALYEEPQA